MFLALPNKPLTQVNGEHPTSNSDLLGLDLMAPDTSIASNGLSPLDLFSSPSQPANTANTTKESSNILDLLGTLDMGGGGGGVPTSMNSNVSTAATNLNNLLDGLSSPTSVMPPSNSPNLAGTIPNNNTLSSSLTTTPTNPLDDLFGSIPTTVTPTNIPSLTVYDKNGVRIVFNFAKAGTGQITINLIATGDVSTTASDFVIQAAVPKSMQLQLEPPSGSTLPPVITQVLKINNPNNAVLKMKLKVNFVTPVAGAVQEQLQVDNFPPELKVW